jgi:release factor glutamine methyltransferase
MRLLVLPGVFRPVSDGWLLARELAVRAWPGARVLDPFTGSGILAIAAAREGAEAVAVDISRRAVVCARLNARLNGVRIRALRGDLFGPVRGERFDLIAANPPYLPAPGKPRPRGAARAWDAGPDGRALLDRFCREAPEQLRPGGEILLVHSSVSDPERSARLLGAAGLEVRVAASRRGPLGPLLAARARELERCGLLQPGEREEELVVLAAVRA